MRTSRKKYGYRCNDHNVLLASLLCLGAFIPLSRAQDAAGSISTASTGMPTSSVPTRPQPSGLDRWPSSTFPSTTSSTLGTFTEPAPPGLFPAATDPTDEPVPHGTVFNYYFLFLAALAVIVAALLWWVHGQRKRRKQQLRLNGQHALARDLEGWAGTRRFMHGRHQTAAHTRREEGLNEHGEAPPAYQPKSEVTVDAVQDTGNGVAIPLRTLTRDKNDRARPPGYSATTRTQT